MTEPIPTEEVERLVRAADRLNGLDVRAADFTVLDLARELLAARWRIAELKAACNQAASELRLLAGVSQVQEGTLRGALAAVRELGRCGDCDGDGEVLEFPDHDDEAVVVPCPTCSGTKYHPTAQKVLGIKREGT